jgi:hypothetical protein
MPVGVDVSLAHDAHRRVDRVPAVEVAERFIDCINRGDVEGLAPLMAEDYQLKVFDEPAVIGRELGVEGWRGYAAGFPDYVIHPHRIVERDGVVAVLGHTTGSHLGLPDDEESRLTLVWVADIAGDTVRSWTLVEDTAENRASYGLGGGG